MIYYKMVIIRCASRRKLVNLCRRDSVLQELAHDSGGENQRRAAKFQHGLGAVGSVYSGFSAERAPLLSTGSGEHLFFVAFYGIWLKH